MATVHVEEIEVPLKALLRALLALPAKRRLSLLDSCGARGPAARLLIAGFDPFETIEACGSRLRVEECGDDGAHTLHGDALALLDERLQRYGSATDRAQHATQPAAKPFVQTAGACIATFSYDLARRLERLRLAHEKRRASPEPDAVFAFYDTLLLHDYETSETRIISNAGQQRIEETRAALAAALEYDAAEDEREEDEREENEHEKETGPAFSSCSSSSTILSLSKAASNMTRDEYLAAVVRIKEHIAAGDIYQANLTQQFVCKLDSRTSAERVFLRLRRDHPASFAAFIRRREDVVVSASPERFLRVEASGDERRVEAWPIKGTRPRGRDAPEDAALRAELLGSEKERAENVMIVDLTRNDLGRVCRYGSVEVAELCAIEEHPTLFHLVSRVKGSLRADVTVGQLLRATFPCGSITGAPKIRAMEIIDEVETAARGLSMGALGYFGFDGALDLNVAIRTMTISGNEARFNVGGGIVADSEPEAEYEESLLKARALLKALGGR